MRVQMNWALSGALGLQETYDYLRTVCTDIHITRGNFDESASKYPEEEVVRWMVPCMGTPCTLLLSFSQVRVFVVQVLQVGGFKVGLCHGHQVRPVRAGAQGQHAA